MFAPSDHGCLLYDELVVVEFGADRLACQWLSNHGYLFYDLAEPVASHYFVVFLIFPNDLLWAGSLFVPTVSHLIFVSDEAFHSTFDALKYLVLQ